MLTLYFKPVHNWTSWMLKSCIHFSAFSNCTRINMLEYNARGEQCVFFHCLHWLFSSLCASIHDDGAEKLKWLWRLKRLKCRRINSWIQFLQICNVYFRQHDLVTQKIKCNIMVDMHYYWKDTIHKSFSQDH